MTRWSLSGRVLTLLLLGMLAGRAHAGLRIGALVDAGMGAGAGALCLTGSVAVRLVPEGPRLFSLAYRYSGELPTSSMRLASYPDPGEYGYVETLVLAFECRPRPDRTSPQISVGLGMGRAAVSEASGVDFRGGPVYRLRPKLGLGMTLGAGLNFPRTMRPASTRLALSAQLVPVSDPFSQVQWATGLTFGIFY